MYNNLGKRYSNGTCHRSIIFLIIPLTKVADSCFVAFRTALRTDREATTEGNLLARNLKEKKGIPCVETHKKK